MALRRELVELGELHGLDRIGFCDATAFEDVHTTLIERKDAGLSADMAFTYRNPVSYTHLTLPTICSV